MDSCALLYVLSRRSYRCFSFSAFDAFDANPRKSFWFARALHDSFQCIYRARKITKCRQTLIALHQKRCTCLCFLYKLSDKAILRYTLGTLLSVVPLSNYESAARFQISEITNERIRKFLHCVRCCIFLQERDISSRWYVHQYLRDL